METIGERLFRLRKAKGLTLQQVADTVGKSKGNIGGYEKGSYEPSANTIIELAKCFNISTDYLLLGEITTTPSPSADYQSKSTEEAVTSDEQKMLKWFRQLDECDQTILIGRAAKMVQLKKTEESEEDEETSPVFSAIRNHSKNRV